MIEYSRKFMRLVVNRELSLIKFLEHIGVIAPSEYVVGRTCFCCFHDNHDTKAAKIYLDDSGECLFCFSEQRSYRSSDAVEKFTDIPLEVMFSKVWGRLSKEDRSYYESSIGEYESPLSESWREFPNMIKDFRVGKMSYDNVLDVILGIVDKENG